MGERRKHIGRWPGVGGTFVMLVAWCMSWGGGGGMVRRRGDVPVNRQEVC